MHAAHVLHRQAGINMLTVSDLDGLPKAALPQHLSMDEVGWAEDAVRPIGHDAERL